MTALIHRLMENEDMNIEQVYDIAWQMTKRGFRRTRFSRSWYTVACRGSCVAHRWQIDHRIRSRGRKVCVTGLILLLVSVVLMLIRSENDASAPVVTILLGRPGSCAQFLASLTGTRQGGILAAFPAKKRSTDRNSWVCLEYGMQNDDKADVCQRCVASRDGSPAQRYDDNDGANMNSDGHRLQHSK
jgi:hypothetical protein